jgi:hypothetical protein
MSRHSIMPDNDHQIPTQLFTRRIQSGVVFNSRFAKQTFPNWFLNKFETGFRFPPSDQYKFAEPDDNTNIILDEEKSNGIPLIKVGPSKSLRSIYLLFHGALKQQGWGSSLGRFKSRFRLAHSSFI